MKFTRTVLALVLPAVMAAQGAPAQPQIDTKAALATMKGNVAKITAAGEKERWQANADAWDLKIANAGTLKKADLDKLTALVARMKANVAKVSEAAEKERWQANIDLWQLVVNGAGVIAKTDAAAAGPLVETMKANVAKITEAGEKERWTANRDLWRASVGTPRATAAK